MNKLIPDDAGFILDEFDSARFWSRVNLNGGQSYLDDPLARLSASDGDCWLWTGGRTGTHRGWYGRLYVHGLSNQAHDLGFKDFGGTIADGLVLDHLCRTTLCIRHNHLEPVTQAENIRRGKAALADRTECLYGHPFTEENTRWHKRGAKNPTRECWTCIRAAKKRAA